MTHTIEILKEYKEAGRGRRDDLWFTFIELRIDFDEIEHKELISEMNAFMPREKANLKTLNFSTRTIRQVIQRVLIARSDSFRQTMARKIQFCTKMCKQALMIF